MGERLVLFMGHLLLLRCMKLLLWLYAIHWESALMVTKSHSLYSCQDLHVLRDCVPRWTIKFIIISSILHLLLYVFRLLHLLNRGVLLRL